MPVTTDQIAALGQFRTKPIGSDGQFVWAWLQFFQALQVAQQNAPQYFFEQASARTITDPSKIGIGSIFYETDTTHVFISDGAKWRQIRP